MVPFGVCHHWRSISRAIGVSALHRNHLRFASLAYEIKETVLNMHTGPRFVLVAMWYALTAKSGASLPKFVAGVGVFRSLTCGGWTYVTSTDDHDWHDIFMISYLVATLPWTIGCLALSPPNPRAVYWRKVFAGSFFATLVPLVYFFIQHKVHHVPGG